MGVISSSLRTTGGPPGVGITRPPTQPRPPIAPATDNPSVLGFLGNLWGDVTDIAEGVGTLVGAVGHDAITGVHDAASTVVGNEPKGDYLLDNFAKALPGAIAHDYSSRYGGEGFDEVRHQLYENPLSYVADALTVASLGGSAAARGAEVVAKSSPEVSNALRVIGEATKGLQGAEWGQKVSELRDASVAGKLPGIGAEAIDTASKVAKIRGIGTTVVDRYGGTFHNIDPAFNPYRRIYTAIGNKLGTESIDSAESTLARMEALAFAEPGENTAKLAQLKAMRQSIDTARSLGTGGIQREYWNTVRLRHLTDKLMGTSASRFLHDRNAIVAEAKGMAERSQMPASEPVEDITNHVQKLAVDKFNPLPQRVEAEAQSAMHATTAGATPPPASARAQLLDSPEFNMLDVEVPDTAPGTPLPTFADTDNLPVAVEQTRLSFADRLGKTFGYDRTTTRKKSTMSASLDVQSQRGITGNDEFTEGMLPDNVAGEVVISKWSDLPEELGKLSQVGVVRGGINTLRAPGEGADRVFRAVVDVDGRPAEVRFVTDMAKRVEEVAHPLRDFIQGAHAAIADGGENVDYYKEQLRAAQTKLEQLSEIKTSELLEEFSGFQPGPMNRFNQEAQLLSARFEKTMYESMEGSFTPLKALERQYYPVRFANGARYERDIGWVGGGSAFSHDADFAARGLPAPVYFPYYDPSRVKLTDFLMAKKTHGMRTLSKPQNEKAFTGALLESNRYLQNPMEAYARRASLAVRKEEALDLINKLTSTFGRRINKWEELGEHEAVMAPDGLVRFYRGHMKISDDMIRASHDGVLPDELSDEQVSAINDYLVANQDDFIGLTKQGVEMWAVPKVVAERIQKASDRIGGVNMRLFYDTPTQMWRSLVLQGSPRWVLNNLLGNTIFLKLQGGKLSDVIRQLNPRYVAKLRAFIGDDALSLIEGGMFSEYNKRQLGKAGETTVGQFYSRIGESKAARKVSTVGQFMQRVNGAVEDAYRRASYLSAAEKEAYRSGISTSAHRFWTSKKALEDIARVGITETGARKAIDEMNYWMNDYQNATPFGRNVIRRFVVPFWSFYRHVGKLMLTMPFEHPERFNVLRNLSLVANDMAKDFGPVPEWAHGAVPLGPGDDPGTRKFLSTSGPNPFSTLFSTPLDILHPLWKTAFEESTGESALTGRDFSDPAVVKPFGSDQQYRVTQGLDGRYSAEPIERTSPSIVEHLMQQVPQYQLARGLLGGGKPYDTANLWEIARGEGVITNPQTGEPQYGADLGEVAAKYAGASTFDVDQEELRKTRAEEKAAAIRAYLRRLGVLPPYEPGSASPQVGTISSPPWASSTAQTGYRPGGVF